MSRTIFGWTLGAAMLFVAASASADDITRVANPNPQAPLAAVVIVPPGATTYYLSGALAAVADAKAVPGTGAAYGDTETQVLSVLAKTKTSLAGLGLTMGDIVQAHVFLAGDPGKNGDIDFAGLNKAWLTEFGTAAQPNKPARSTFKVAGLVAPGFLVEIEFVAAKMK